MRYIIEIDAKGKKGSEAIKYLRNLKAGKEIAIHSWDKLHPGEVALPFGRKPTDWQWEEYLNRPSGRGTSGEKVFKAIREKLKREFGE